jgi:hypothetical protein
LLILLLTELGRGGPLPRDEAHVTGERWLLFRAKDEATAR